MWLQSRHQIHSNQKTDSVSLALAPKWWSKELESFSKGSTLSGGIAFLPIYVLIKDRNLIDDAVKVIGY